eukprot:scaffold4.g5017.t1
MPPRGPPVPWGHPGVRPPPGVAPPPPYGGGTPPYLPPPPGGAGPGPGPGRGAGPPHGRRAEEEEEERTRVAAAWAAFKREDGTVYYHNSLTKESTYQRPEGFAGDVEQLSSKPVPVSSERVPGTEWTEVSCQAGVLGGCAVGGVGVGNVACARRDGRKYFFHRKTQETSWTVPPEVEARRKLNLDPARAAMLERAKAVGAEIAPEYRAVLGGSGTGGGGGGGAGAGQQEEEEHFDVTFTEEELGLEEPAAAQLQQQQQQGGAPPPGGAPPAHPPPGAPPPHAQQFPPPYPPPFPPPGAPAAPGYPGGAGVRPPAPPPPRPAVVVRPPPGPPPKAAGGYGPGGRLSRDEAVEAFRELLADKGIHAFSSWELSKKKLQGDPRWQYVPLKERREVFEEFCKDAASTTAGAARQKPRGPAALQAAAAAEDPASAFRRLLDEIQEQCLAAAEARAAAAAAGEGGEASAAAGADTGALDLPAWDERLSAEALEQLWGADPRWQRCAASQRRQLIEERLQLLRAAVAAARRAAFQELLREARVRADSRWSSIKERVGALLTEAGRATNHALGGRGAAEDLFREHVAALMEEAREGFLDLLDQAWPARALRLFLRALAYDREYLQAAKKRRQDDA